MAGSDGFYLTLPSDGSMETFPQNTVAQFKTLLPQTVDLTDGEWQMGLTEMMYGSSVKNILANESYFDILVTQNFKAFVDDPDIFKINRFQMKEMNTTRLSKLDPLVDWKYSYLARDERAARRKVKIEEINNKRVTIFRIQFRSGPYVHPKALISEINEGLSLSLKRIWETMGHPEQKSNMKLVYYENFDRIEYQYNGELLRTKNPFSVRFPVSLALKMGFGTKAFNTNDESMTKWINVTYLAPNTIDLYENLKQMYVYCDVVEPQMVGSNALKLLRVVPVTHSTHDQMQAKWEPVRAEYLKLSKKHFDTIEIQIRTPLGTVMPFISGKSILKLHFKKLY